MSITLHAFLSHIKTNNKMKNPIVEDEIIDLEEYALTGKPVNPHAKKFRIKIDHQKFVVEMPSMTGAEILKLASKDPKRCQLREKIHGKFVTIAADEQVDFRTPGVERFTTLCSDVTDGGQAHEKAV
jgi:hypothetical protein